MCCQLLARASANWPLVLPIKRRSYGRRAKHGALDLTPCDVSVRSRHQSRRARAWLGPSLCHREQPGPPARLGGTDIPYARGLTDPPVVAHCDNSIEAIAHFALLGWYRPNAAPAFKGSTLPGSQGLATVTVVVVTA